MEENTEPPIDKKIRQARFQRWQKITLDQFGYTLNLVWLSSVATIGFAVSWIKSEDFKLSLPCYTKVFLAFSLLALSSSIAAGLWCAYNRLTDFRCTAQRIKQGGPRKEYVDALGARSWLLLKVQVISFGIGVAALGAALLWAYEWKLSN